MNIKRPRYFVSSSTPRRSLIFVTAEERDAYERDEAALIAKYRAAIREKYGIWASNQNKFVDDESDLNDWDSRDYL